MGYPIIARLKDQTNNWACWKKWSLEYFEQNFGKTETTITTGIPTNTNVPYHLPYLSHVKRGVTLSEAIGIVRNSEDVAYIDQKDVSNFPGLEKDMDLSVLMKAGPEERACNIWIGSAGTKSGFHYDLAPNVLIQVVGSKHVFMVAPSDSPYMYPFPDLRCKSQIDPFDLDRFPHFTRNAELWHATLEPGDMILMPPLWWHYVTGLTTSISMNIWFDEENIKSMYDQPFSRWQRVVFGVGAVWEFLKVVVGWPRVTRLFSPPSEGVVSGRKANAFIKRNGWKFLVLVLLSVAVARRKQLVGVFKTLMHKD